MPHISSTDLSMKMKKKRIIQVLFLLLLIAGTFFIINRHRQMALQHSEGRIFGTSYHMEYEYTAPLDSAIVRTLKAVDGSLSMFNKESTVSRINDGRSTQTDSLFREVYQIARGVSQNTDGALDVTVAPLVNLWGFGFERRHDVTAGQVDSIRRFVGYGKLRLKDGHLLKADSRTKLDFSAVAKGYGVDCVAHLFDSLGISNYMVEIGGEVVVKGMHPARRPWKIGVSKPTDGGGQQIQTILTVTDIAMATSGNYLRYYEEGGRRYAHTIDPHTGYPVQHELLSATVFAPNCATADAYATAFMVLGLERAKQVLAKHPDISAYFIYTTPAGKYATWMSPKIKKYVR